MEFENVIGQSRVKQILVSSLKRERLAHAYLFHGQPGVGKDAMAISMAMGLNCINKTIGGCGKCSSCSAILRHESPSFRMILPVPTKPKSMKEVKYLEIVRQKILQRIENLYMEVTYDSDTPTAPVIGIDQIRILKQEVMLKLAGGGYRVLLISHADKMTTEASNSLLKLLEEPPQGTIIFLTTSYPEKLPETIVSRCQAVRFDLLSDKEIKDGLITRWNVPEQKASFLARMAAGSLERALKLAGEDFENKRATAITFLKKSLAEDTLLRLEGARDVLAQRDKAKIQETLRILEIWLHDIFHLISGFPERVVNFDQKEMLEDFKKECPSFDVGEGMKYVEQAIDLVEKNVYIPLIIHSLSIELRKCRDSLLLRENY